jgi:TET-associated glycosyltransferase-like protein
MARNACFGIAGRLGVTHFIELDDDYYYFGYRFQSGAHIITNLSAVFAILLGFYESTNIRSLAFGQGGDHIGGFSGIRLKRKCMNSFLCSTGRPFRFVGAMNEDVNTYATLGSRGLLFVTFTGLQLDQRDTQSQSGGITAMYQRFGTFCKAFTTVMMLPSAVRVSMMSTKHARLHHSIDWGRAVPCIVPDRYRKDALARTKPPNVGAHYPSRSPSRAERRTIQQMTCKHCGEVKSVTEMSMLECMSPSDCCKECWQEFLDRNQWFRSEST